MSEKHPEESKLVHGSATGHETVIKESARGAMPMNFVAEPKVGPSGPSGASDVADTGSNE